MNVKQAALITVITMMIFIGFVLFKEDKDRKDKEKALSSIPQVSQQIEQPENPKIESVSEQTKTETKLKTENNVIEKKEDVKEITVSDNCNDIVSGKKKGDIYSCPLPKVSSRENIEEFVRQLKNNNIVSEDIAKKISHGLMIKNAASGIKTQDYRDKAIIDLIQKQENINIGQLVGYVNKLQAIYDSFQEKEEVYENRSENNEPKLNITATAEHDNQNTNTQTESKSKLNLQKFK